jgi:UDP-N-acetylmuramoylalanine-D-glutamate ligase
LTHRIETVGDLRRDVDNDSKSTNVVDTRRWNDEADRVVAGGKHKGEPYTDLSPSSRTGRAVIAYGEAAKLIEHDLAGTVPLSGWAPRSRKRRHRAEVARERRTLVACVLSYDMFDNYSSGDRLAAAAEQRCDNHDRGSCNGGASDHAHSLQRRDVGSRSLAHGH